MLLKLRKIWERRIHISLLIGIPHNLKHTLYIFQGSAEYVIFVRVHMIFTKVHSSSLCSLWPLSLSRWLLCGHVSVKEAELCCIRLKLWMPLTSPRSRAICTSQIFLIINLLKQRLYDGGIDNNADLEVCWKSALQDKIGLKWYKLWSFWKIHCVCFYMML